MEENNSNNSEEKHGIVYNICMWAMILAVFGVIGFASVCVFEFIVDSCIDKYGAKNVVTVFAVIGGLFVLYRFIDIVFWIFRKVVSGVISDAKEKEEEKKQDER